MSKAHKDPAVYLWDMLYEIDFVERVLLRESIYDEVTSRAVLRSFTVLGEAAKRVDQQTKAMTPSIPWQRIIDTRNFLSHEYENVNLEKIKLLIENDLPSLQCELRNLYQQLTGNVFSSNHE
jgi:uncharacterized protein with HEPN domain